MAYVAGDYRITITGTLTGGEIWSNTWSVQGATNPGDPQLAVTAFHAFYDALSADRLSNGWSATVAKYRDLVSGVSSEGAFEPVIGQLVDHILPTQLGVRISLDDLLGHRGGPFLCGFSEAANDAGGVLASAWQDDLVNEVENLQTQLLADGMALALDRPTVPELVGVARVRVGQRFDVIRKRGNEIVEEFVSADL